MYTGSTGYNMYGYKVMVIGYADITMHPLCSVRLWRLLTTPLYMLSRISYLGVRIYLCLRRGSDFTTGLIIFSAQYRISYSRKKRLYS